MRSVVEIAAISGIIAGAVAVMTILAARGTPIWLAMVVGVATGGTAGAFVGGLAGAVVELLRLRLRPQEPAPDDRGR